MAPTGWPPPAAGLPTHTSYWFSSRRSFRSCRVCVSPPLTRLRTHRALWVLLSSPCVPTYLGRLCTQRVCWLPTNPPWVRVRGVRTRPCEDARGTREGEEEVDEKEERRENERKMMYAYAPLDPSSPPERDGARSNRGRRFGAGQRHRSIGRRIVSFVNSDRSRR